MKVTAGQDLDTLIAEKVMGLRRAKVIYAYWSVNPRWTEWTGSELDRKFSDGSDLPLGFEIREGVFDDQAPRYSSDFKLAWEVSNRMRSDGFSIKLWRPANVEVCTVSFICGAGPCEKHGNPIHNHHGAYDVEAATAPLAICIAALLALKIEGPDAG